MGTPESRSRPCSTLNSYVSPQPSPGFNYSPPQPLTTAPVWLFLDGGHPHSYSFDDTQTLEASFQCDPGGLCEILFNGQYYTVDFSTMQMSLYVPGGQASPGTGFQVIRHSSQPLVPQSYLRPPPPPAVIPLSTYMLTAPDSPVSSAVSSHQWEWNDSGTYRPYGLAENQMLEQAFATGRQNLSLAVGGHNYEIDLGNMHQISGAGFHRTIRRSSPRRGAPAVPARVATPILHSRPSPRPPPHSAPGFQWEWDSDSGYLPCQASVAQILENAATTGQTSCSFTFGIYSYMADLTQMTQTNTSSGKPRKIRRLPPLPARLPTAASVSPAATLAQWDWQNDSGGFQPFVPQIGQILETTAQAGQRVCNFTCGGYTYTADLSACTQTNTDSCNSRCYMGVEGRRRHL